MKKFQKIEMVFKNLAIEYVENEKTASEFVKECDEDVAALLGKFKEYQENGATSLFDTIEAYNTYRGKQQKTCELIKTIREE